jgi:hypothetical protein
MQRVWWLGAALLFSVVLLIAPAAHAQPAPVAPPAARGLAVVAEGDATAAASALAHAVYGDPGLLPSGLDEAHARALVGDPVSPDAPRDVRDLAETRAALHGDDAPTRSLLSGMVASLHVKGLIVVAVDPAGKAGARVFVAQSSGFDAVLYEPDPSPPVTWGAAPNASSWSSAANALHRGFADVVVAVPRENRGGAAGSAGGVAPVTNAGPSAALAPTPPPTNEKPKGGSKPFYTSPWFWGAIGAAAFAGAAFYFATRDSSDPNIALQVQVPK